VVSHKSDKNEFVGKKTKGVSTFLAVAPFFPIK
jgi:hypothetical protein